MFLKKPPTSQYPVDLHMHSTHSDGSLTPAQLVEMAVSRGVKTIALTDHDTIDGLEELSAAAAHVNIEWIPGVEISARLHREIHGDRPECGRSLFTSCRV